MAPRFQSLHGFARKRQIQFLPLARHGYDSVIPSSVTGIHFSDVFGLLSYAGFNAGMLDP